MVADDLEPAEVTDALGLAPTLAFAKGDPFPPDTRSGQAGRRRRWGIWRLESTLPASAELDEHLRSLLDQLDPRAAAIRAYAEDGFRVHFFCGLFLDSTNEELSLPPATLARVAQLGASLDLDIYGALAEDGEDG